MIGGALADNLGIMMSGHVDWDTSSFWDDPDGRIVQITAANYKELILDQ